MRLIFTHIPFYLLLILNLSFKKSIENNHTDERDIFAKFAKPQDINMSYTFFCHVTGYEAEKGKNEWVTFSALDTMYVCK